MSIVRTKDIEAATEAINCLKRIPFNDQSRKRCFQMVADFLTDNGCLSDNGKPLPIAGPRNTVKLNEAITSLEDLTKKNLNLVSPIRFKNCVVSVRDAFAQLES